MVFKKLILSLLLFCVLSFSFYYTNRKIVFSATKEDIDNLKTTNFTFRTIRDAYDSIILGTTSVANTVSSTFLEGYSALGFTGSFIQNQYIKTVQTASTGVNIASTQTAGFFGDAICSIKEMFGGSCASENPKINIVVEDTPIKKDDNSDFEGNVVFTRDRENDESENDTNTTIVYQTNSNDGVSRSVVDSLLANLKAEIISLIPDTQKVIVETRSIGGGGGSSSGLTLKEVQAIVGNSVGGTAESLSDSISNSATGGLTAFSGSSLTVTGSVTANSFYGDGSNLTGIFGAVDLDSLSTIEVGSGNTASGLYSSAFGYSNSTSRVNAQLFGRSNFSGTGDAHVGIGILNNQTGGTINASTGIITGTPAVTNSGDLSIAVGISNLTAGAQSTAVGYSNTASVINSSAIGYSNDASGDYSSAFGYDNTVSGDYSSAFGFDNEASVITSSAFGYQNTALNTSSSAFGYSNNASEELSSAFGLDNTSSGYSSSAFGYQNTASGITSSAFGYLNTTSGDDASAFGFNNTSSGNGSSASGYVNNASGIFSSAFGYGNTASGVYSSASGYVNNASGENSSAFGNYNTVSGDYASAFGYNNQVSVNNSSAIGSNIDNLTADSLEIGYDNTTKLQLTGTYFRPFADNTQTLGGSSNKWTAVHATNGTIQTSDERLKKDIEDLNYGLDEIMQLRPVSYNWRDESNNDRLLGLIAQEVLEIMPEVVNIGDDEHKTLGINYSNIIPTLISAIQELSNKIENQVATVFGWLKFNQSEELCVDDVCITKDQFKNMLTDYGASTYSSNNNDEAEDEPEPETEETPEEEETLVEEETVVEEEIVEEEPEVIEESPVEETPVE